MPERMKDLKPKGKKTKKYRKRSRAFFLLCFPVQARKKRELDSAGPSSDGGKLWWVEEELCSLLRLCIGNVIGGEGSGLWGSSARA